MSKATSPEADRRQSVLDLRARYDIDPEHSAQVTHLSGVLFDRTVALHRMGTHERELLAYAALLHDTGLSVSQRAHHKHAMRLIRSARLPGFGRTELAVVSLVARYHRKALPKVNHPAFAALRQADRDVVRGLAGLLRVADGLDRTHCRVVTDMAVEIGTSRVVLRLHTTGHAEAEVWAAQRKADLFVETFGRDIIFRVVDAR